MSDWATFSLNGWIVTGLPAFALSVLFLYIFLRGLGVVIMEAYVFFFPTHKQNG